MALTESVYNQFADILANFRLSFQPKTAASVDLMIGSCYFSLLRMRLLVEIRRFVFRKFWCYVSNFVL